MALGLPVGVGPEFPSPGAILPAGRGPVAHPLLSVVLPTVPDGARRGLGPHVLARGHTPPVADLETFGSLPPWNPWLVDGRPFSPEDRWALPSPLGHGPPSSPEPRGSAPAPGEQHSLEEAVPSSPEV